eukprot:1207492-Rhodomonas_salina.2
MLHFCIYAGAIFFIMVFIAFFTFSDDVEGFDSIGELHAGCSFYALLDRAGVRCGVCKCLAALTERASCGQGWR